MPFDGVRSPQVLEFALEASGLKLLDPGLLERHKLAELQRNPPSWLYRHSTFTQMSYALGLVAGLTSAILLSAAGLPGTGSAVTAATFVLLVLPLVIPIHGPARWEEHLDQDLLSVHPEIRAGALRLKRELPGIDFRVGELFQDRVKLDPYLVADYRGTRILLGIWDGDRVILRA